MGNALATRSENDSLFAGCVFGNLPLLGAMRLTFVVQLAVIYVPVMQRVFQTVSLTISELPACLLLRTVVLFAVELRKRFGRRMAVCSVGNSHPTRKDTHSKTMSEFAPSSP